MSDKINVAVDLIHGEDRKAVDPLVGRIQQFWPDCGAQFKDTLPTYAGGFQQLGSAPNNATFDQCDPTHDAVWSKTVLPKAGGDFVLNALTSHSLPHRRGTLYSATSLHPTAELRANEPDRQCSRAFCSARSDIHR